MPRRPLSLLTLTAALSATLVATQNPPAQPPASPPAQQSEVQLVISTGTGTTPKYAVPDFLALSGDNETKAAAQTIAQVLWDDLNFEREVYMIPRDTYGAIPAARSVSDVPFDRWRELGTDGLVIGTVQKEGSGLKIQVRLFNVGSRQTVFSREYTGSAGNPRAYAHTTADEIHQQQRALRGIARTKLTFSSDRDREKITNTVENRDVKEIYVADYDGANQRRITVNRALNITPTWAPDGRSIAYTSYARGFPTLFISFIYEGRREEPTRGSTQNWLPAWSQDGTRIAFTSNRDGNSELYVMNRDGSGIRRLTNHPAIDTTPTWSPTGVQLAFTSDRSGSPAIYVVGSDGLNLRRISQDSYCDRPTWSPAPFNELAFVCRTGPGYDIKIFDFATGEIKAITFGEGSNESPAYSANGRHLAFTSTRAGKVQVFTVGRDGKEVRQVTRVGSSFTPDWSH
ncbi:MAG: PD40 domain-containing protein [Vicinamibacteria bacterium]|nr:PD40 domain-containing protein [Vicinamibacteria bacterium]